MSLIPHSQRHQYFLSVGLLFVAALFALVARGQAATAPVPFLCDGPSADGRCPSPDPAAPIAIGAANELPVVLPSAPARLIFVTGVVEALKSDLFGRPQRVAIVSVNDQGVLLQNRVEDVAAGEELKDHVGEGVTARGLILMKADGTASLLVDAFRVHGSENGFHGADD